MAAPDQQSLSTSEQPRPTPPRYWWLKRILLTSAILILALIALRWWWGWEAERRLQAKIAEYRAAGQPVTIEDFQFPPVPDEDNAALILQKAAAAITAVPNSPISHDDVCDELKLVADWAVEVGRIMDANAEPLRLAREARSKPHTDWQIRMSSPVINVLLPSLGPQRNLGKLLCTAALYQHHAGDDAAAVETLHAALSQARRVGQRSFLICHLVAVALDALAVNAIEEIAPDLRIDTRPDSAAADAAARAEQIRALITHLLNEEPLRESWRWAWYGERLMGLDCATPVGSGRMGLAALVGTGGGPAIGPLTFVLSPWLQLDAVFLMESCTAAATAGAADDYPTAQALMPRQPEFDSGIETSAHLLSRILTFSSDRAAVLHFRSIAMRRMAATALAIRLYELDHGQRPNSLDGLVPEYLSAIPSDPFAADGRPLGYVPHAPQPVLYSVNVDAVDDAGEYALSKRGGIDWESKDLPFFLDGDRPRAADPTLATRPSSTQAVEDHGNAVDDRGQADQRQPADDQP